VPFASAYRRANLILIHARAKTLPGFQIDSPPWIVLPADARNAEIGEAVRTALAAYREGEPAPDYRSADWKELRRARYHAAGVRSERTYVSNRPTSRSVRRTEFCDSRRNATAGRVVIARDSNICQTLSCELNQVPVLRFGRHGVDAREKSSVLQAAENVRRDDVNRV
jgi:hypothetical protein